MGTVEESRRGGERMEVEERKMYRSIYSIFLKNTTKRLIDGIPFNIAIGKPSFLLS